MNRRFLLFTLGSAVVWYAAFVALTHLLLDASDGIYGAAGYRFTPVINAVWLVLLFPFGLVGELLPHRFVTPGVSYAFTAANALLWGGCVARFLLFVRQRYSRSRA